MTVSGGVRTAAVVFTDLAESTVIRSRLGEVAAERLRVVHDAVVRRAIEGAGGTVVKTLGDGLMATFVSAADAVAAAVAVQQGIDRHNRRASERLAVRVGVSVGDVDFEGTDCHGLPVVEAQRLESAARPGQILCADLVVALARGRGHHVFESVGSLLLKGLPGPVAASSVAWEPRESPRAADLPPALRQAAALPFSGRKAESSMVADAWSRCRGGSFEVVLVAGEPGIGKTRLVAEAAADARADGATVLAGRCDEDLRVPFGPFVGALRWAVEDAADDELLGRVGSHAGELVALVPDLRERLPGVAPRSATDADTERLQLFQAVCSWLGAGGMRSPTVLVLDDLHWADTGTVLLLRHLVRVAPPALLVLGTYRDTDISRAHPLGAALADLRQAAPVTRLVLRGLDEAGVRELVGSAGGRTLAAPGVAFADLVCAETAGNPLFVGEVLRHLAERGDLELVDGRWTSERDLTIIGIPEGVTEVIGRRLSRLEPATEAVLRTAAVIGLEFEVRLLAAVLDRSEGDVLDDLEQAVSAALVTEIGVDRFRFAHALVRETMHAELSASRRAREHRRVAEAVERHHAPDLDGVAAVLAQHWGEASSGGDPAVAVDWAARAGEHDLARRAPDEAARWFGRALDLLDDHEADRLRRRFLLSRLAHAQSRANDPGAGGTANAAARLAIEDGDVGAAADELCLSVRLNFSSVGQPCDEEKISLLERTLVLVGDGDVHKRGRLLAALAGELVFTGDVVRRDAIVGELRVLIDTVEDPVARWDLMAGGMYEPGRRWADRAAMEKVRGYCDEAVHHLADSFERRKVHELLWATSAALGDRNGCERALEALARDTDAPWKRLRFAASSAYLDGRLDDHERLAGEHQAHLRSVGHHQEVFTHWYCTSLVRRREQGTVAELPALVAAATDVRPAVQALADRLTVATVMVFSGEHDSIDADGFDPARLSDEGSRAATLAMMAEVVAAAGSERVIRKVLEVVEPFEGMHLVTQDIYWGSHDRLAALLRDRLGEHRLADQAFDRAVRALGALRTPVWLARTELDWAESLARRSMPGAAREHLEAARSAIGDLPLTDSRNRADRLEARLA